MPLLPRHVVRSTELRDAIIKARFQHVIETVCRRDHRWRQYAGHSVCRLVGWSRALLPQKPGEVRGTDAFRRSTVGACVLEVSARTMLSAWHVYQIILDGVCVMTGNKARGSDAKHRLLPYPSILGILQVWCRVRNDFGTHTCTGSAIDSGCVPDSRIKCHCLRLVRRPAGAFLSKPQRPQDLRHLQQDGGALRHG